MYAEIKDRLAVREVLEYYGAKFNKHGFARCMFHSEQTASLTVKNNFFKCFGCGEGGSVIDFVMKYFNLPALEAARKLNGDFSLNLMKSAPETRFRANERQKELNRIKEFEQWEKRTFHAVCGYYKASKFRLEQIAENIDYFDKYLPDTENISFAEYLIDTMILNTHDINAQIEFYKNYGRECDKIAERWAEINK